MICVDSQCERSLLVYTVYLRLHYCKCLCLDFQTQIPYRWAFYHTVQVIKDGEDENLTLIWMCIVDGIVETVLNKTSV